MSEQSVEMKKTFADLFNRVATSFDTVGPRTFAYFGERLVENTGINEGATVLDIATGKGASLFPAVLKAGPSGTVTGIDFAKEMVNLTLAQAKENNIRNVNILEMDAEKLAFSDESFDYIICGFGIFFMPDYKKALNEFMRVLKPCGKFGFTTFLRKEYEEFSWMIELAQKYFPPQEENNQKDQHEGPVFDTEEGLLNILTEGGFKNINIFSEEKEFILKDAEEWWERLWSMGSRLRFEKLSEEILEQYKADAFEKLNEMKREDGIHFKISVLFAFGTK